MTEKTFLFRGIDVRASRLERTGDTALDCSNMRFDDNRKLVKREELSSSAGNGVDLDALIPDGERLVDFTEFSAGTGPFPGGESFFIITRTTNPLPYSQTFFNKFYTWFPTQTTLTDITPETSEVVKDPTHGWLARGMRTFDGKCSFSKKNGALYFQSESNSQSFPGGVLPSDFQLAAMGDPLMMKFDGQNVSCAGISRMERYSDPLLLGNFDVEDAYYTEAQKGIYTHFIRLAFLQIDHQGTQRTKWVGTTAKDMTPSGLDPKYGTTRHSDPAPWIKFNYPNPLLWTGSTSQNFDAYYYSTASAKLDLSGVVGYPGTDQVVPATDIKVAGGNWLMIAVTGQPLLRIYIKDVDMGGGTVTITTREVYISGEWRDEGAYNGFFSANLSGDYAKTVCNSYVSTDYTAGFETGNIAYMVTAFGTVLADTVKALAFNQNFESTPYEDYVQFTPDFADFHPELIRVNPPEAKQIALYGSGAAVVMIDDKVAYFSDISLNGTFESFSPFDNFIVGEEKKGAMTGIFSNETFLALFREREVYLVTGNLFTGNIRVQSFRNTNIGCVSPGSIIELDGQCLFMSARGPYLALENGTLSPIGDPLEPIFTENLLATGVLPETCRSAIDVNRELIYMFTESSNGVDQGIMWVYDYRYQQWLKYNGIDARGGMAVNSSDNLLYVGAESAMQVELAEYSSGVDAYYQTNFETLGLPGIKKRFRRLQLYLTTLVSGEMGIQAFKDWKSETYTDETMTPDETIPMDSKRMNSGMCYANSFKIISLGTEKFESDGFEYSYDVEQEGLVDDVRN